MPTSGFWYQPLGRSSLVLIDCGKVVMESQLQTDLRDVQIQESASGRTVERHLRTRSRVNIRMETDSRALRCRLHGMVNHLKAGGTISYAEDISKAWAGYAGKMPLPGDSTVQIDGTPWSELGGSLATSDEVILQAGDARYLSERLPLSYLQDAFYSGIKDKVFLAHTVQNDWSDQGYCLVRHSGFYPVLRLAKEARNNPGLYAEREIRFFLDLVMDEDIDALRRLSYVSPGITFGGVEDGGKPTVQDLLRDSTSQEDGLIPGKSHTGKNLGGTVF